MRSTPSSPPGGPTRSCDGDAKLAIATIDRIVDLLTEAPEINEFKHTTVPR
jgi:hypothetical protein